MATALSIAAVAAKAQQLPQCPWSFTAVTTLGWVVRQSLSRGGVVLFLGSVDKADKAPCGIAESLSDDTPDKPKNPFISAGLRIVKRFTVADHDLLGFAFWALISSKASLYKACRFCSSDPLYDNLYISQ